MSDTSILNHTKCQNGPTISNTVCVCVCVCVCGVSVHARMYIETVLLEFLFFLLHKKVNLCKMKILLYIYGH